MANEIKRRCSCMHCRVRGVYGAVILITLGILFLIGEYTRFGIADLWPILLIVVGAISIFQSMASRAGHTES